MLRHLFITVLLLSRLFHFAQTGPAGVGSQSGNVFWLKADKGTSSTVNNTPLSSWNDQSGNNINMNQTVTAQQPSFATNVMNGLPAVLFDNATAAGTNDKMIGPDSPILDNTAGYSFFTVTRPLNLNGDARVIVSKRTTVSVDQSFMLFYYTSNKFHVDIQTTDNRFNSVAAFASNNNYIIDVIYDGTLPAASRSKLYTDETLDITANESAALVPDNSSPIILGTTDASDPRPFGGYMSEIIIYRTALFPAQRTIVNNYLSAKYNIALSANDKYSGDNPGNGDYDKEVAGIGKESTGSNTSFFPSACGGLGITAAAGFDNTDYVMTGYSVTVNAQETVDVAGMTGPNNGRWLRDWYIDVTNTGTPISADLQFGATDAGMGSAPLSATAGNYVLLYRAGLSGAWTELATASSVTGDKANFNNFTLTADGYYTLGSKNTTVSVLPVELISFKASPAENMVKLSWATASEKNNASFTVEKTKDGESFQRVVMVKGAGNTTSRINYTADDPQPFPGLSYYRLKQTDLSGEITYSKLEAVYFELKVNDLSIYPNPNEGVFYIASKAFEGGKVKVQLVDALGKTCLTKSYAADKNTIAIDTENKLARGAYMLFISIGEKTFVRRIITR